MVTRWMPLAAGAASMALVLSPMIPGQGDSFPISTYPIYAHDRADVAAIPTAVGITDRGETRRLSLDAIAGTDDPLLGTARVANAIRTGDASGYCEGVADRLGPAPDLVAVEVVTERRDLVTTAVGEDGLLDRIVHARCEPAAAP